MAPNFYREVDLVKESVIPPMSEVVLSSNAKEAAPQNIESKTLSYELQDVLGENKLAYGISLRTPEPLVNFFGSLRSMINRNLDCAAKKIDSSSQLYYDKERKLTTTIANLHSDPREELLPGFTYILVASMSGSILTRNRNVLLRFATPLLFGITCFSYVLPITFSNSKNLAYDLEKNAFPDLVQYQDRVSNFTKRAAYNTIHFSANFIYTVQNGFQKTSTAIKEWTGLNV